MHRPRLGNWPTLLLAGVLATGATLGAPARTVAADPAAAAAAHLARTEGGTADGYRLVQELTVAAAGPVRWAGKFEGPDQRVHTVYVDDAGNALDPERARALRGQSAGSATALAAKADAALRERVAAARSAQSVPVAVWLEVDTRAAVASVQAQHPGTEWVGGRPTVGTLDEARELRRALWEARRGAYEDAASRFARDAAKLGATVGYASEAAPLLFVDVRAGAVEQLASLPGVVTLGLERSWTPAMTSAAPTVDANWTTGSGDQGAGIRVAVVEYGNVRNSGDLSGRVVASHSSTGTLSYSTSGQFDHPTWVAGAIAGGGTYGGTAPASRIVSASTGGGGAGLARDRAVIATTDWAISPSGGDADIVNVSLIQDTSTGSEEARRYFDSVVDEDFRVVVAAAGNYNALGTWRVGSPGTSWNVLTVGGTDDRGTANRADDRMWYIPGSNGSSYVDPPGTAWNPNGDFNKPNLSAPAVGVRTSNGLAASGTSVATPIVSGLAAQLISRAPILTSWPETVRALLMAGAVHRTRMPDGSYNRDVEGVGSASALWSNRILVAGDATYGGYRHGVLSASHSEPITVGGGQRIKVALTWNSRAGGSSNLAKSDTLASDLDLRVRLPDGTVVGSYSFDNSYESVDVVSPISGQLVIEVVGTRVGSGGERFALAWSKIGGDATPPRVTARAPEAGEPWSAASVRPTIAFSEPVTGVTASSVQLAPAGGGSNVPATVTYSASVRRATVTPSQPLAPGPYRLTLTNAIRDRVENRLAPQSWTFTVVASATPATDAITPSKRAAFASGSHTGYQFDSAGRVTAGKTSSLASASGASVDRRGTIAGQPGVWLRIVNGLWAGYWIRESPRVRLGGTSEQRSLAPTTRVAFAAGSHTGHQFNPDGSVAATLTRSIAGASGANTNARAVINGAWHLLVTNGIWAGYWVPETGRSYLPGIVDHRDLRGASARFASGTHVGARYTAEGVVQTAKSGALATASTAPSIAWGIVNGGPRFLIGAGVYAGYWVPESTRIQMP